MMGAEHMERIRARAHQHTHTETRAAQRRSIRHSQGGFVYMYTHKPVRCTYGGAHAFRAVRERRASARCARLYACLRRLVVVSLSSVLCALALCIYVCEYARRDVAPYVVRCHTARRCCRRCRCQCRHTTTINSNTTTTTTTPHHTPHRHRCRCRRRRCCARSR